MANLSSTKVTSWPEVRINMILYKYQAYLYNQRVISNESHWTDVVDGLHKIFHIIFLFDILVSIECQRKKNKLLLILLELEHLDL